MKSFVFLNCFPPPLFCVSDLEVLLWRKQSSAKSGYCPQTSVRQQKQKTMFSRTLLRTSQMGTIVTASRASSTIIAGRVLRSRSLPVVTRNSCRSCGIVTVALSLLSSSSLQFAPPTPVTLLSLPPSNMPLRAKILPMRTITTGQQSQIARVGYVTRPCAYFFLNFCPKKTIQAGKGKNLKLVIKNNHDF